MAVDLRLLRSLTGWPDAVPDDVLFAHGDDAEDELRQLSGLTEAPTGMEDLWARALAWLAAASALPSLNTFALSGAAQVGRLESAVEFRFLRPEEAAGVADGWRARGLALVARLNVTDRDAPVVTDGATLGDGWMAVL